LLSIKVDNVRLTLTPFEDSVYISEKELLHHIIDYDRLTVQHIIKTLETEQVNDFRLLALIDAAVLLRNHGKYDFVKRMQIFVTLCELNGMCHRIDTNKTNTNYRMRN